MATNNSNKNNSNNNVDKNSNNNNNKDDKNLGFNINEIKDSLMKYKKYIASGAMLILLAVVIAASNANSQNAGKPDSDKVATSTESDGEEAAESLAVDAYPEINALFEEYYACYAQADIDAMSKFVTPITDTEKSYIQLYSKYVDQYENIKCYTKNGQEDGDLIVWAAADVRLKGIETCASNLDCFYVKKDENGAYFIDNAYNSRYNQFSEEDEATLAVKSLIEEAGEAEDVVRLKDEIQEKYQEELESDADLKNLITGELRDEIAAWVASYGSVADDTKADDAKSDNEEADGSEKVQTRTAYAKTEVNLRKKPTTESKSLKLLKAGTKVTIYGKSEDGWFKVDAAGKSGYVKKEYIVSDKAKVEQAGTDHDEKVSTRTAYAKTEVNLRKKASTDSKSLKLLKPGTKVTIYGKSKDGWFKVKADGKSGYVKKEYIVSDKSKVEKADNSKDEKTSKRSAYAKTEVNLRKKASTDSKSLKLLKPGASVTVYGKSKNGWFKVKANGQSGYVKKEYIVFDKSKVEKPDNSSASNSSTRTAYAKTGVRLRKKRSTNSAVVDMVDAGTKVTVYGKSKNGWLKVKAKGKTGFIKDEFIVSDKSKVETAEETPDSNETAARSYYNEGDRITLSDSVNVRKSMSETADRVGLAFKGDVLTVIMSYAEGWTKVSWNGQTGYVKTAYLK